MEQPIKEMKAMKIPKTKRRTINKTELEKSIKPRLENLWVNFLKDYAKSNGITYSCALSDPQAKEQYKMMKIPMMTKKEEPVMMTKKEQVMEMMNSKTLKRTKKPVMVVEPTVMIVEPMPKKTRKKLI